jgi:hypothetical protein
MIIKFTELNNFISQRAFWAPMQNERPKCGEGFVLAR